MNSATMKTNLIITLLILFTFTSKGQDNSAGPLIDDSKIQPWITQKANYQSSYHFGESESESTLILIIDRDSCYAQIRSGYFENINGNEQWIQKYENLKNVQIIDNKFFSDKTNGEFVIFDFENKLINGLMINNPWNSWIFYSTNRGHEIGFQEASINLFYPGKFSYASWRFLSKEELAIMSSSDLQLMRNEIYARYGYIFEANGKMDQYFRKQSWYNGRTKNVDNYLSGLERQNIKVIQAIEKNK